MTREEGKLKVERLVDDFYRNEKELLTKAFQETEARSRFIDPFFEALGWDFSQTNLKKDLWDVHREFSQKDNSSTKKPDYAFRVKEGNKYKEKFFVEAKAPWVKLTDNDPVYQAKRYAFSSHGKTPIVILTDFQEFRVFNGMERPVFENPLQGLIKGFDLLYTDYLEKWDLIYDTFSKDAVYSGSINQLAGKISKKTKTLDDEFLKDITEWRELLARNIALRNKDLTVNELNEAVQRIIDRLIFIRNLEDRDIEPENSLLDILNKKENLFNNLVPVFSKLNDNYNGLLFKPHFSEKLSVDDKVVKDIIKKMCYPVSPFQFDIIEPEILGRIYERFLGSKIRLTENHQAKVEEKPEVRHAGGVYYTPQYIVDYIVENTVGELVKNKTPEEIENIKILDPACGSGSFLIGAFDYLIKYHESYFASLKSAGHKKYKNDFYNTDEGEIKLTLSRKNAILKNNIFGVDIDREATEVAIMSLYLKLLDEGYDRGQAEFFMKGHILPDMTGNIKCGNSLVVTDFYKKSLFNDSIIDVIKPFDWQTAFPLIFKNNGFDVVIGNPPYIRVQELDYNFIDYCKEKYKTAWKRIDISILFIELANSLLKDNGLNGYITSNQFLSTEYGKKARELLLNNAKVVKMIDFGDLHIFQKALTYVSIFILSKGKTDNFNYYKAKNLDEDINSLKPITINSDNLNEDSWILEDENKTKLLQKLKSEYPQLSEYAKCWYGIISGADNVLMFNKEELINLNIEKELLLPIIRAQDCSKYSYSDPSKYIIYPYQESDSETVLMNNKELSKQYPKTFDYLKKNKSKLSDRKDSRKEMGDTSGWYSLVRFGKLSTFKKSKIVTPGEVKNNKFGLDETGSGYSGARVFAITTENVNLDIKTLLGILNSKLIEFFLHSVAPLKQGGYYSYSSKFIDSVPLPQKILEKDSKEIKDLNNYVSKLLHNNKKLETARTESDIDKIIGQNNFMEKEIESIVCKLYNLNENEVKLLKSLE